MLEERDIKPHTYPRLSLWHLCVDLRWIRSNEDILGRSTPPQVDTDLPLQDSPGENNQPPMTLTDVTCHHPSSLPSTLNLSLLLFLNPHIIIFMMNPHLSLLIRRPMLMLTATCASQQCIQPNLTINLCHPLEIRLCGALYRRISFGLAFHPLTVLQLFPSPPYQNKNQEWYEAIGKRR